jgi:hypothetical protein
MAMLRSPCALIMENATLLMMTIHEHAPLLAADLRDVVSSSEGYCIALPSFITTFS